MCVSFTLMQSQSALAPFTRQSGDAVQRACHPVQTTKSWGASEELGVFSFVAARPEPIVQEPVATQNIHVIAENESLIFLLLSLPCRNRVSTLQHHPSSVRLAATSSPQEFLM